MGRMTRETLVEILKRAPSIKGSKNAFEVAEDHEVTFYLAEPGRAMAVPHVRAVDLGETIIELRALDMGHVFTTCEAVFAVAVKPPRSDASKRAGFG